MYLGFCGKAWELEKEASLLPTESAEVGGYKLTYRGSRREVDQEKQMIFADMDVERNGRALSQVHPAKFIYNENSMGPTTEVSQLNGLRDDLYVVVGSIDFESKRATFRIHVNPLVACIWLGVMVLIVGSAISLWPDVSLREVNAWSYVRATAGVTSGLMFAVILASSPAAAIENDRDVLSRAAQAREAAARERSLEPAADAAPSLAGLVGGSSGLSIIGGLLAGTAFAWAARRRPA
jgi:cytochrome c-type biogenesis protein CcmF